jgi:hypothetical protein
MVAGKLLAIVGLAISLDQVVFRNVAAGFLILFGLVLVLEQLQLHFAVATASLSSCGQPLLERISTDSLRGQSCLGLYWASSGVFALARAWVQPLSSQAKAKTLSMFQQLWPYSVSVQLPR